MAMKRKKTTGDEQIMHRMNRDFLQNSDRGDDQKEKQQTFFLKSENIAFAQQKRDLLKLYLVVRIDSNHPGHDQDLIAILFGLGPLGDIDDVLQRQRMDFKHIGNLHDFFAIAKSLNIYPGCFAV